MCGSSLSCAPANSNRNCVDWKLEPWTFDANASAGEGGDGKRCANSRLRESNSTAHILSVNDGKAVHASSQYVTFRTSPEKRENGNNEKRQPCDSSLKKRKKENRNCKVKKFGFTLLCFFENFIEKVSCEGRALNHPPALPVLPAAMPL